VGVGVESPAFQYPCYRADMIEVFYKYGISDENLQHITVIDHIGSIDRHAGAITGEAICH
jgi:hypothetical protein